MVDFLDYSNADVFLIKFYKNNEEIENLECYVTSVYYNTLYRELIINFSETFYDLNKREWQEEFNKLYKLLYDITHLEIKLADRDGTCTEILEFYGNKTNMMQLNPIKYYFQFKNFKKNENINQKI